MTSVVRRIHPTLESFPGSDGSDGSLLESKLQSSPLYYYGGGSTAKLPPRVAETTFSSPSYESLSLHHHFYTLPAARCHWECLPPLGIFPPLPQSSAFSSRALLISSCTITPRLSLRVLYTPWDLPRSPNPFPLISNSISFPIRYLCERLLTLRSWRASRKQFICGILRTKSSEQEAHLLRRMKRCTSAMALLKRTMPRLSAQI